MTEAPALRMTAITKRFPGVTALDEAQIAVGHGEVMALMGANGAGKSTMMNVLGGVLVPDSGTIEVAGVAISPRTPRDAAEAGIAFVHQELTMFDSMSVLDNMFIDAAPALVGQGLLQSMRKRAGELLARVGADVDLDMPVEQLGTGDKQLIEIARALRDEPKIIILDEPTSSLSERERKRLFGVIGKLRDEGTAVIFITHFIEEIFEACDRVTVMRDGRTVAEEDICDVNATDVVRLMLGPTEDAGRIRKTPPAPLEETLRVKGLNRKGAVVDASLSLRAGEIVGLWGLLGSGRTELIRAIAGLDLSQSGTLEWRMDGRMVPISATTLRDHIGLVTEDRRGEGIIATQTIEENTGLPNLSRFSSRFGIVDRKKIASITQTMIERLSIKTSGPQQTIGTLSGGNQQKVVLGRWLEADPRVFFLDEPTRGLDVKAKTDILKLIVELAEHGCAVLVVSSELEELMRICDRYLVIARGKIIGELPGEASENDLMSAVG